MYKKLISSILLLNILCITNVDFGMELIQLKDFSIGFYNDNTHKAIWHDHQTNAQTQNTTFNDSDRTSCYMTYYAKDKILNIINPMEQTILKKFDLSSTNQEIINKILQLKNPKNSDHIIIYDSSSNKPMVFYQSNITSQFKIEQFSQTPFITNSSTTKIEISKNLTPNTSPTQPIIVDKWNVKIKKDHWINPIDYSENNKIYINTERIYPYCAAILNLENNLLTITNNDGLHIVFDISKFNSQATQLVMETSDKSPTQLWHSPSKEASKEIYTITKIQVIWPTKKDNSETPRLDSTPRWQNKMIIGSLTLAGVLAFFLFMYLRK